jgi:hypothetical protein
MEQFLIGVMDTAKNINFLEAPQLSHEYVNTIRVKMNEDDSPGSSQHSLPFVNDSAGVKTGTLQHIV